ncbi:MAG: CPBP family intramembrane glutamic endopeptidase, partial [Oscillospiraceae bacterium]
MVLMFFAIAVIPAVFEEFAFRGVLLSALRKYGDGFAIITSSVIFGLLHGSLTAIPFAVIAGLTMGYVYVRTGNLFVNIAIHFLNNAVAVVLENLTVHLPETTGLITTAIIFYGMILLGIVALIILCLKKKIHFHLQKPLLVLSGGQKLACVLSNPGFILFASICVTLCATALLGVPVL